jgi:hypothetical protein
MVRARLLSGTGEPAERAALVDALPSKPEPAEVVAILTELLRWEQSPIVQARALRRLGRLGDAASLTVVRPFLSNPRPEVVAAAAEAVLRLDRQQGIEIVAPLLESGDAEARAVVLRSLLDVGNIEGSGVVVRLSMSESLQRRRMALEILSSISSEVAWPLGLRMFEQEHDPELMDEEARLLERLLPEKGIEKLYDLRLGLDLAREGGAEDPVAELRLDLVARTLAALFRTFRLTEAEIESLESAFQQRVQGVLQRAAAPSERGDPRKASAAVVRPRLTARWQSLPPHVQRWVPVLVGALLLLGIGSLVAMSARQRARQARRPAPVATGGVSLLGKAGDEVAFEGETLMVDPGRRTLVVMKDRAIGVWVAAAEAPWPLLTTGQVVRVAGRIVAVRDKQRLYVDADTVVPVAPGR